MSNFKTISLDIQIRFRDIDALGHVNNAVYHTYLEEGRKAFFHKLMGIVDPAAYPIIMAKSECDYVKPLLMYDRAEVKLWIGDVGTKSFTFKYEIINKDDPSIIYIKAKSILVFYDFKTGTTQKIPTEFLEKIADYRENGE